MDGTKVLLLDQCFHSTLPLSARLLRRANCNGAIQAYIGLGEICSDGPGMLGMIRKLLVLANMVQDSANHEDADRFGLSPAATFFLIVIVAVIGTTLVYIAFSSPSTPPYP